ncbi:hypothetical protein LSAT2_013720 [Lamellibrachia satsuma]|nr:hypothetical protein LSAT2_013720 [Lamellibrachia satsuma]
MHWSTVTTVFQIRNKAWIQTCVDAHYDANSSAKRVPKNYRCHNGGNQHWVLSRHGAIWQNGNCIHYSESSSVLLMTPCHGDHDNHVWLYENNTIRHVTSKKCLDLTADGTVLAMTSCTGSNSQSWFWKGQKRVPEVRPIVHPETQ